MAVTAKRLVNGIVLGGLEKVYTASANVRTVIKALVFSNPSVGAIDAKLYLVPTGNSAIDTFIVLPAKSIAAGATLVPPEALNQVLEPLGELWADGAGLTIVASGVEIG